jgi:predicted ester cyclase
MDRRAPERSEEVDVGEARSIVEAFYEKFNQGDLEATRPYFAEDMENISPTGTLHGWEAFRAFAQVFQMASPDAKLVAGTWVEDGNLVATEGTFAGTFTGPLQSPQGEVPPTGASFELPFVEINEIVDGRIKSHRTYYDQMRFMAALGLTPS